MIIRGGVAPVNIGHDHIHVGDNGRLVDPGRPCKNFGGLENCPGVHVASDDMSQNQMASIS
jgi:hypothetical protein